LYTPTFLKIIQKNIYKIGKTADHARFKSLCVRGKVPLIALVNKDVEDILHADNRIVNEDYKRGNWMVSPWGKFDEFIVGQRSIPSCHPVLGARPSENKNIRLNDFTTDGSYHKNKFG
jgi:hypothetical protein